MVCNILNSYLRKPPVFLRIPFVYGPIVGIHVTPSIAGSRRRLLRGKLPLRAQLELKLLQLCGTGHLCNSARFNGSKCDVYVDGIPLYYIRLRRLAPVMSADSAETMGWKLLKQGAEARVYSAEFFGQPAIVKERFPKRYRVPALDEKLTHRRMGQEVRSMARCRWVAVPFPNHRFWEPLPKPQVSVPFPNNSCWDPIPKPQGLGTHSQTTGAGIPFPNHGCWEHIPKPQVLGVENDGAILWLEI